MRALLPNSHTNSCAHSYQYQCYTKMGFTFGYECVFVFPWCDWAFFFLLVYFVESERVCECVTMHFNFRNMRMAHMAPFVLRRKLIFICAREFFRCTTFLCIYDNGDDNFVICKNNNNDDNDHGRMVCFVF